MQGENSKIEYKQEKILRLATANEKHCVVDCKANILGAAPLTTRGVDT